jgi:hypothetical protein
MIFTSNQVKPEATSYNSFPLIQDGLCVSCTQKSSNQPQINNYSLHVLLGAYREPLGDKFLNHSHPGIGDRPGQPAHMLFERLCLHPLLALPFGGLFLPVSVPTVRGVSPLLLRGPGGGRVFPRLAGLLSSAGSSPSRFDGSWFSWSSVLLLSG